MKKSRKIILAVIALAIILMSFVGGQVYAKYMSKVEGHGTAEVANWNFKVNEKEEQLQAISLNSTINNKTVSNNKIAPGTQGSFQIKLDATGAEVGIDYIVRFENESNKPTNLKFKYDKGNVLLDATKLRYEKLDSDLVKSIWASIYYLPILVSLNESFEFYYPGGCNFDKRPIDFHLKIIWI